MLVDLIQIYGKFLPQISSATWNHGQLGLSGTATKAKFGTSVEELVGGLIETLEKRIVPPLDTQRDEVTAIFGAGRAVGLPQKVGRDDDGLVYPHQAYQLLPGDPALGNGVVLWVQFKNETVARAGLRNYCVNLHRPVYVGGPEFDDARQQQREEIARERRLALADLLKIDCHYKPTFGAVQGTRNSDKGTGSVSDSPGADPGK